jgi:peptidoglycan/LPS O-acetylase OafA/YrhL
MLPVIFVAIRSLLKRHVGRASVLILVLAGALLVRTAFVGFANWFIVSVKPDPRLIHADGRVIPSSAFVGLVPFAIGIVFADCYLHQAELRLTLPARTFINLATGATVLGISYVAIASPRLGAFSWLPFMLFGILVFLVSISKGQFGLARLLEVRPVKFLGVISYSFYLYHDYVLWNTYNVLLRDPFVSLLKSSLVKALVAYLLTVAVAWVSYRLVEAPVRRMGTTYLARVRRKPVPVPA